MSKKAPAVPAILKESVDSLVETLSSYFERPKTPAQLWAIFEKEQADMQVQMLADEAALVTMIETVPHYVAIACFRKVKFKEDPIVDKLMKDYTSVTLEDLQAAKCVEVALSVRPLIAALKKRPELTKVLSLCAFAELSKALKLPRHP